MLLANNKVRTTKLKNALLTAGLLGGAACSVLSAGSVSAAPVIKSWNEVFVTGFEQVLGDKIFSNFKTDITGTSADSMEFEITDAGWDINANFDGAKSLAVGQYYSYDVTIDTTTAPNTYFKDVFFDYTRNNAQAVLKKDIYTDNSMVNLLGTVSEGGTLVFASNYTLLHAVDRVEGAGSFDNISNVYTQRVPGPLPLLGAGAAFGFSRRIRSRIKKARFA